MELIGITPDNGRLIKMSPDEFKHFDRLALAIEGHTIEEVFYRGDNPGRIYPDFGERGVFGAIEAFYLAQFKVNALQDILDEFKNTMFVKMEE